jgi:DNA invertase Pin-like site-specific DNA recombinase
MALMQVLQSRQVGFHSLVEGIDTTTATGQFFFQITGAFAELERNLIRERTRAGLASARQRGRRGGRPKAIDAETFAMAVQLYQAQTSSVQSICTRLGIARRTFYRYLATRAVKEA